MPEPLVSVPVAIKETAVKTALMVVQRGKMTSSVFLSIKIF